MKKIWDNQDIPIPESVAVCPECGAPVVADVYEIQEFIEGVWTVADDGSGMHIQCTREDGNHYQMPYVDWMPLDFPIAVWINANYDLHPGD